MGRQKDLRAGLSLWRIPVGVGYAGEENSEDL